MVGKRRREGAEIARVGLAIDRDLLERFDSWLARRGGGNRSEAVRDLVRDRLIGAEETDTGEVVAATSIVYDHHRRLITRGLTEIQHEHGDLVVSALHVHLEQDRCLEVIILRGPARDVRRLGERLIGEKGVLHGGLFVTRRLAGGASHGHAHPHHVHGRTGRRGTAPHGRPGGDHR